MVKAGVCIGYARAREDLKESQQLVFAVVDLLYETPQAGLKTAEHLMLVQSIQGLLHSLMVSNFVVISYANKALLQIQHSDKKSLEFIVVYFRSSADQAVSSAICNNESYIEYPWKLAGPDKFNHDTLQFYVHERHLGQTQCIFQCFRICV